MTIEMTFPLRPLAACTMVGLLFALGSCGTTKESSTDPLTEGFAELRATADDVIGDFDRREQYLEYSRAMEYEIRAFDEYASQSIVKFRAAFIDYAVDREQLQQMTDDFRKRQAEAQTRFVSLQLKMAAVVTPDEWKKLSKSEWKALARLRVAARRIS